jgi:hypothetical protein
MEYISILRWVGIIGTTLIGTYILLKLDKKNCIQIEVLELQKIKLELEINEMKK